MRAMAIVIMAGMLTAGCANTSTWPDLGPNPFPPQSAVVQGVTIELTQPTHNTDGSLLTDLVSNRLRYSINRGPWMNAGTFPATTNRHELVVQESLAGKELGVTATAINSTGGQSADAVPIYTNFPSALPNAPGVKIIDVLFVP